MPSYQQLVRPTETITLFDRLASDLLNGTLDEYSSHNSLTVKYGVCFVRNDTFSQTYMKPGGKKLFFYKVKQLFIQIKNEWRTMHTGNMLKQFMYSSTSQPVINFNLEKLINIKRHTNADYTLLTDGKNPHGIGWVSAAAFCFGVFKAFLGQANIQNPCNSKGTRKYRFASYVDALKFCKEYGLKSHFDPIDLKKSEMDLKERFDENKLYIQNTFWTGEKFIG